MRGFRDKFKKRRDDNEAEDAGGYNGGFYDSYAPGNRAGDNQGMEAYNPRYQGGPPPYGQGMPGGYPGMGGAAQPGLPPRQPRVRSEETESSGSYSDESDDESDSSNEESVRINRGLPRQPRGQNVGPPQTRGLPPPPVGLPPPPGGFGSPERGRALPPTPIRPDARQPRADSASTSADSDSETESSDSEEEEERTVRLPPTATQMPPFAPAGMQRPFAPAAMGGASSTYTDGDYEEADEADMAGRGRAMGMPPGGPMGMIGPGDLLAMKNRLNAGPSEEERDEMRQVQTAEDRAAYGVTSTRLGDLRRQMNHVSFNFDTGKAKNNNNKTQTPQFTKVQLRAGATPAAETSETDKTPQWKNVQLRAGTSPNENADAGGSQEPAWKRVNLRPGPRPMTTALHATTVTAMGAGVADPRVNKAAKKEAAPAFMNGVPVKGRVKSSKGKRNTKGKRGTPGGKGKPPLPLEPPPPSRDQGANSLGDGCYLVFDPSDGGKLYAQWTTTGLSAGEALGFFRPETPIPRFIYRQNDGRINLNITDNKKRYYEAWTKFWLLAREVSGTITVLGPSGVGEVATDLWTLDYDGKVLAIKPGNSVDTTRLDYVAALPKSNPAFQGVEKVASSFFTSTAQKTGACIKLEG